MTILLVAASNTNVFSQGMEIKKTVTPQEVVENVHKAAELLKTQGKEGIGSLRDPQYELNRMSGVSAESPKVAVLFEVKPKTEGKEEYLTALKTELAKMPGFIRVERFASLNEEGKLLSLSVWENEDAAAAWRNQLNHRGSQKKGHDALFERYHISVASIIREYTQDDRKEAPADSNQFLGIK